MSLTSVPPRTPRLLRDRSGVQRVTNIELFFDLVYCFAVTQLSHYLLGHADLRGALQGALLLLMVWLVWCVASSALAIAGGLAHGNARALLWLGSVCVAWPAGWPASTRRAWAARGPRTGPSRAATSPSAARRSS